MASWYCEPDVDIRPGGADYDGPPVPTHNEWWRGDNDPRTASPWPLCSPCAVGGLLSCEHACCIECGEPIEAGRLRLYALTCSAHATH